MSLWQLIVDSLRFHRRTNLAVALAVAAASAVLTGALLVGDSMRGSLRHLLLDQLGQIDELLVTDRFFRTALAEQLAANEEFGRHFSAAVPAVVVQGTLEKPSPTTSRRAGDVTVIGASAAFWKLGNGPAPCEWPAKGQVVLNAPLARELNAAVGDEVLLRIGTTSQIPADSALGRKTETVRNRRLTVSAIVPAEGLGRFALHPSQLVPLNAFVAADALQSALEQPDKANAIFVAGRPGAQPTVAAHEALENALRPTLADYGLEIQKHSLGYMQLTSNRMLLDPPVVAAARQAFAADEPQALFTYLANTIAGAGHETPYSTITAIDFASEPPLGPFRDIAGHPLAPLADDEIALNRWIADDLGVKPGDPIEITYFEPETTHGAVRESKATFRLKAVVALAGLAADPDLTPQLPGVTDQASIADWDPPFPFESARVRKKDEDYWDEHRTTPKAFVSLATGRRLWSSRFGNTTALRFRPSPGPTLQAQESQLRLEPSQLGMDFKPIKRLGLEASSGTTPFDALFVGFSFFIMAAALMLVALLFRLGVEQRAAEVGLMSAVGLRAAVVRRALLGEAAFVALVGSLAGVALGIGYAWLMLAGLKTWWLSAISSPFLSLYVSPRSLIVGGASGLVVSLLSIAWSLRRLAQVSVRRLLAGQTAEDRFVAPSKFRWLVVAGLFVAAILLVAIAPWLRGEAQAGAFVGSGALVLAGGMMFIRARLRSGAAGSWARAERLSLTWLALRSGARNPSRSTLSIGLIAAASFLIVALSAFRLDPQAEGRGHDSGSGGFNLVAQSDQPIYQNLDSPAGREELGFSSTDDALLAKCESAALRVHAGDDASCLNLYQPTQPRVLGVPERLIQRGGFSWAATLDPSAVEREHPWWVLDRSEGRADGVPVVPAVVDFNTATYSLHKQLGQTIDVDDGQGAPLRLQIVGLLKNSIFQGDVLIGERAFLRHYPQVSGHRYFLVDTRELPLTEVEQSLETTLGDYGFDAQRSVDRLRAFFAVQNTYLSTFQSLGGLGLLLGTFGLATAQLRSVLERRGELALLRAAGFRRRRLAELVMIENALLLVGGLALGVGAALVAVLPHWLAGGASVPWLSLAATLSTVLVVGLLAGLLAVRATLRAELLPALRKS